MPFSIKRVDNNANKIFYNQRKWGSVWKISWFRNPWFEGSRWQQNYNHDYNDNNNNNSKNYNDNASWTSIQVIRVFKNYFDFYRFLFLDKKINGWLDFGLIIENLWRLWYVTVDVDRPKLTADATKAALWAWGDHVVTSNGAHSGHVIGYLGNGNAAGNKTDNFLGIFRNETWPNKLSPDEIETNTLWTRNGSNFEGRRSGVKKQNLIKFKNFLIMYQ